MAQPLEKLHPEWYNLAQLEQGREPNPVVTPYKKSETRELFNENGLIINHRYLTMKNGTIYPVLSSHFAAGKHIPLGLQGMAHVEGVGWITRPADPDEKNESLYVQRAKLLGTLGVEATVVGIPQNFGKWISYDDYVDDINSITVNEAIEHDRDPSVVLRSGISQAAMLGTGLTVRGKEVHDINTVSAHLSVLCLPDGIKLKDWKYIPGHLLETLAYLPFELRAAKRMIELEKEKRDALLPTADTSRTALYTQPQMLRSLLSGKTGEYALQLPEIAILAEMHKKDALARGKRWKNSYLGDHPSVRINLDKDKSHADIVDEIIQSNWGEFETANISVLRAHPEFRAHPESIGRNVLYVMRNEFPQFTKPFPVAG